MNNFSKARDRLKMRIENMRRGKARYCEGDCSSSEGSPSEVYTKEVTKELFNSAIESINYVIKFFNSFKDLPSDLSSVVEELNEVVFDAVKELRKG